MSSEEVPSEILHDFESAEDNYVEEGYDEAESGEDGSKPTPMNESMYMKQEPVGQVMAEDDGVVLEDGTVDMPTPEHDPVTSGNIVRRVVRRVRAPPDGAGPSSSMLSNSSRKIYVRRKRTPEEELSLRYEEDGSPEKRAPAPPGKRGRRPIMLPLEHTEPVARSEAARRTGRPVVVHPSGVEFVIPSSLEAHPIQLSDIIPDNPAFDILKDDEAMPYCSQCHSVLRTFHALEYHVMSVHLKYRPYRCMFCVKEYFYTEDEAISHLKSAHIGKPIHIIRELKEEKEELLAKFFQTIFLMAREGEELTQQRVEGLQQAAYYQMQKYHRMRFKVPEVVARQRSQKEVAVQTFVTMAAPQTMVQMPVKPAAQFMNVRREPIIANVKMVQLPNGEIVRQVVSPENHRYLINRDMEIAEHEAYDQIDVVEDELGHHVHY